MGLGAFFKNIGERTRAILSGFPALSSVKDKTKDAVKTNSKLVLIGAGAMGIIVVLLLVFAAVTRQKTALRGAGGQSAPADIPLEQERLASEDFFLPYEPDFVPDVLLERETKDSWTEEDARPFWTNPLDGNEAVWRKRIESGVDALLETVP